MSQHSNVTAKPSAIGILGILAISAAACAALHVAIWWFCGWEWLLVFLVICVVSNVVLLTWRPFAPASPSAQESEAQ